MYKLKLIVSNVLDIQVEDVNEKLIRENNENWDSFNHLLVVSEIERQIGIKFTMEEIENIKSYRDLEELVIKKVE